MEANIQFRLQGLEVAVQGVIVYDPQSNSVVVDDVDRSEYDLALDALEGSVLRMVRQGQRVILTSTNKDSTHLRLGSAESWYT